MAGRSASRSGPSIDLCGERLICQPPLRANEGNLGKRPPPDMMPRRR
jgi:hypothetical protein